jgi:DNA-binding NtrC family response regulator
VLGSAALLAEGGPIDVAHLPVPIAGRAAAPTAPSPTAPSSSRALRDVLADEERRRIVDALQRCAGNQSRAAELLGMPRRTLVKRLREYTIPRGRVVPETDSDR